MSSIPIFASDPGNQSMPAAAVIPVPHYPDVPAASAWLCRTFGFTPRFRIGSRRIQLTVGDGAIVVVQPGRTDFGPRARTHSVMVRVQDADRHCEVAVAAGARIVSAPCSRPHGERQYTTVDPWGCVWTFSQSVRDTDPGTWGGELVSDLVA